ncbi:uncharacterized protein YigA (DUF484 family) [Lachnospiraceae bacterium PFB1-21]
MKKEELLALGIEEDKAKEIMALHGKEMTTLNGQIATLTGERDQFKGQLETNQKELDALKESAKGNEELTAQLADYQAKLDEAEKASKTALEAKDKEYALKLAIGAAGALDTDIVLGQLDLDTIKVVDGKLQGFDEQLNGIKEGKPFLFPTDEEDGDPAIVVPPGNPSGGKADPKDPFAAKVAKYQQ